MSVFVEHREPHHMACDGDWIKAVKPKPTGGRIQIRDPIFFAQFASIM
jgi:hypothetical protein